MAPTQLTTYGNLVLLIGHILQKFDSAGAGSLDDPIRFIYTYDAADDRNNGMTINVVSKIHIIHCRAVL